MRVDGVIVRVKETFWFWRRFRLVHLVPTIIYRILAHLRAPGTSVCLSCPVQDCVLIADPLDVNLWEIAGRIGKFLKNGIKVS